MAKIKIDFDPVKHEYFVTGGGYDREKFPSVTTILNIISKPALIFWAANITVDYINQNLEVKDGVTFVGELELTKKNAGKIFYRAKEEHKRVKEEAAKLGTRAHALVEDLANNKLIRLGEEDERVKCAVESYIKWANATDFEPLHAERRVALLKQKIAGTVDLVGTLDGKLTLADIKTSNRLYPAYDLQVSAYCKAWEETYGEKIERAIIIRLSKEVVDYEVHKIEDIPGLFRVFKNCINVWRWDKKNKK